MLKHNGLIRAARRGTITPRKPNWARDWIICGRPSSGPWAAWKAWKAVPIRMPSTLATTVPARDRPRLGPTKPTAMDMKWKLLRNQNGPWSRIFPCRS